MKLLKTPILKTFGFLAIFTAFTTLSFAQQTASNKTIAQVKKTDDPNKYKFYNAATLSGIDLKQDKNSGNFLLNFDQQLTETGTVSVKNSAGKVLFTNLLAPNTEHQTRTMDVGKLSAGIYAIEVKTSDTTFWKKVRIRK